MNVKIPNELSGNLGITYYIGGFTSCGAWWGSEDTVCRYSKLYFPVDGEMEIEIDGKIYIGKPGELFLIPEGLKHSFRLTEKQKLKKYWFHFSLFPLELKNAFDKVDAPFFVKISDAERVEQCFKDIEKFAEDNCFSSKAMLHSRIFELLSVYFAQAEKEGVKFIPTEQALPSLSFVAKYMGDNLKKNITLEELATLANLHPNYLIRSFKQQFGVTPVKYLNDLRLEKIASLLCGSDLSFKEIMEQTGFSEPAYFSGFFKQKTGYSPREYRKYCMEHSAPPPSNQV